MVSTKLYEDMKQHYEDRIERLEHDADFWRKKAISRETINNNALIKLYEKILNKLLGDNTGKTDELFMFDGAFYKPVDFNLSRTPGSCDTLNVEFVKVGEVGLDAEN